MPPIKYGNTVLDASASASAQGWGQVAGHSLVEFKAGAQFKRGIDLELGLDAIAGLDASFRKFIAAQAQGEARGTLRLKGQIQVPMNLFEEAGAAVRLQAVAELAAGVQLSLGLSIGDFILLAEQDPKLKGLPAKLFRAFMEEVTIGGGLYAKAAVSAMAYVNLVVSGRAIAGPSGEPPGFTILAEAGAGLKAGAGFRVFANLNFQNFRRFVGRSIDLVVDEAIDDIGKLLPDTSTQERVILDAFRVPAKIGLRSAYEIGELIATRTVRADAAGRDQISLRSVQVVLEECQRYLLDRAAQAGLHAIQDALTAANLTTAQWDALATQRQRLAQRLLAMPADPFVNLDTNRAYWLALVNDALKLGAAVAAVVPGDAYIHAAAMVWAGSQLLFSGMERVTEASAAFSLIGLSPQGVHAAFTGALAAQPPLPDLLAVKTYINTKIGHPADATLTKDDLALFLAKSEVLDTAIKYFPDVQVLLDIFRSQLGQDVAKLLLTSIGGIVTDTASGQVDARATLVALLDALRTFIRSTLDTTLLPAVRECLGDRGDLRLYFEEVMVPALRLSTDVTFEQALAWNQGSADPSTLKEALSSVLMMLVGRSLVVTLDVITAEAQKKVRDLFYQLADHVDDPGGLVTVLQPLAGAQTAEVIEIVQDALKIGGDVFGPWPDDTRARVRGLLYEIIEPLPPGTPADFMAQLRDGLFLPNPDAARALADELLGLTGKHLQDFLTRVLARLAELMLEDLQAVIESIEQAVRGWITAIEQTAEMLRQRLADLVREIAALAAQVEAAFDEAADKFESLLGLLGGSDSRSRLRADLTTAAVDAADHLLRQDWLYRNVLPGWARDIARNVMKDAIRGAMNNAIMDAIFDAVGDLAWDLEDFLDDVRSLDPHRGLASGISNLLLNRLDDAIRSAFGGRAPGLDVGFRLRIEEIGVDARIDLGRVELPLDRIVAIVRAGIEALGAVEQAVDALAQSLATAFAAELQINEKESERARVEDERAAVDEQVQATMSAQREITIVEPAPGAVYEGDLTVTVHLTGVPSAFLGLGADTQPRVHVWLNHDLLPLTSFTVEERGATEAKPGVGLADGKRPVFAPGQSVDNWGRTLSAPRSASRMALDRPVAHWASGQGVVQRRSALAVTLPAPRTAPPTPPAQQAARVTLTGAGSLARRTGLKPAAGASLSGRKLTATQIRGVESELPPGLTLTLHVALSDLDDGFNTLVVAIVDGRGQRVQQTVSFIASSPLETKQERREPRLVGRPERGRAMPRPRAATGKGWRPPAAARTVKLTRAIEAVQARRPDPRRVVEPGHPKGLAL
jgi:hypothetical protein